MNKKEAITIYEFKKFTPRTHNTKRYVLGHFGGEPLIVPISNRNYEYYKKNYKVKLKKVI
jgi:hypothetical protein